MGGTHRKRIRRHNARGRRAVRKERTARNHVQSQQRSHGIPVFYRLLSDETDQFGNGLATEHSAREKRALQATRAVVCVRGDGSAREGGWLEPAVVPGEVIAVTPPEDGE